VKTLILAAIALGACAEPSPGVTLVGGTDAPAPPDAAIVAPPPTCNITSEQRAFECKMICSASNDPGAWCPGSDSSHCWDECVRFETGTTYCPPL